ncbi:MAG: aminoacyl-histidine dipeptidase [Clostridiales bacterium]|nr:aminoacyl-histidine dipeptidase [Clostridiales bacterium]
MDVLRNLNPQKVFYYFEQICRIPHGSGNVDRLSDYLVDFARERKLVCIQDELKNVIIIKEATSGYEDVPPIILQGHMDMVAVKKPEADIDMETEGLELKVDGDYIYAENTSLGGDDGIAVAYALAILDDDSLKHPRLEIIITVDEEVGMDGARGIDVSMLKGKRMLNLDSEEEGILWAGCAGGARVDWEVPVTWEQRTGSTYEVSIKGLLGGHSGAEIDKERGNADWLLGRLLADLCESDDFSVAALEGGLADNAIPREATATITVNCGKESEFIKTVKNAETEIKQELQTKDPGFFIEVTKQESGDIRCLTKEAIKKLSYLLFCAPNGVQAMSADIEGLVETSLNMGIVKLEEEGFKVQFSVRSSLESSKRVLIKKLKSLVETAGGTQEVRGDYPGWAYQVHSPFRDMAVDVYRKMFGKEPEIQAIHAGLECGLLSAKIPGLECISIGPNMKDIHTTEERLSISSTERVWNYVLEILSQK